MNFDGVFVGGDCVSGPATVIKAIEAGKVAAANIDNYLGYNHKIRCDVEIPERRFEIILLRPRKYAGKRSRNQKA